MSTSVPDLVKLRSERDQLLFEIRQLQQEIETISTQLADAEAYDNPDRQVGSDWWYRARDAKRHKSRERRVLIAKVDRLDRTLGRYSDDAQDQSKAVIRDVLKTLFHVAKAAARYYEEGSEDNGDKLAFAIDRLDTHVPGWDGPQEYKPAVQRLRLVD